MNTDYPTGAIHNGYAFIERLELNYNFENNGWPLSQNEDFIGLKECFEHLAKFIQNEIIDADSDVIYEGES